MQKVFVINQNKNHDFSAASEFGTIVFMNDNVLHRFGTSRMFAKFKLALMDSHSEDMLLISGMAIMSSIACAIFATQHKKLNLLLWQKETGGYVKRTINL